MSGSGFNWNRTRRQPPERDHLRPPPEKPPLNLSAERMANIERNVRRRIERSRRA